MMYDGEVFLSGLRAFSRASSSLPMCSSAEPVPAESDRGLEKRGEIISVVSSGGF